MANSAIHLLRVIITTPLGVLGVNIINDPITVAYRMPFSKQFYDQSDTVPGFRILYIAINEVTSNILKMLVWVGLLVASSYVTEVTAMKGAFIVAAVFSLGIALQPKAVNNQE